MGHWARLDDDNIVQEVICIKKEELDTGNWGDPSKFVKTSYNTRDGKHYTPHDHQNFSEESSTQHKACGFRYAGIGMKYDATNDVFYDPVQPFPSWTLNNTTWLWEAPIAYPADVNADANNMEYYIWDEDAYQADTGDPKTQGWVGQSLPDPGS